MDESKLIELCENIASIKTQLKDIKEDLGKVVTQDQCDKKQANLKLGWFKMLLALTGSGIAGGSITKVIEAVF